MKQVRQRAAFRLYGGHITLLLSNLSKKPESLPLSAVQSSRPIKGQVKGWPTFFQNTIEHNHKKITKNLFTSLHLDIQIGQNQLTTFNSG